MTTSKNTKSKRRNSGSKAGVVPEAMPNKEIRFTMKQIKENPDGSADYNIDMSDYTQAKLIEMAILNLFKQEIARQKKKPWYKRWFSFKTNCIGNCNQGRRCDCV